MLVINVPYPLSHWLFICVNSEGIVVGLGGQYNTAQFQVYNDALNGCRIHL